MKKGMVLFLIWMVTVFACFAEEAEETEEEDELTSVLSTRRDTIRYGINSEIITVIGELQEESNHVLDSELLDLFMQTSDKELKITLFDYFLQNEVEGAAEPAREILVNHDFYENELVIAALDYLANQQVTDALSEMTPLLDSNQDDIVSAVVDALGELGDSSVDNQLLEMLEASSTEDELRAQIVLALGNMKSENAFEVFIEILDDDGEDSTVQRYTCNAMGKIGNPEAIPYLRRLYSDADTITRNYALSALAEFDGEEIIELLMQALRDSYWKIRIAAAQGLAEKQYEGAVDILIYKARRDPEDNVKREAFISLSKIATEASLEFIYDFFMEDSNNPTMRVHAVQCILENAIGERSLEAVMELVLQEWDNNITYVLDNTCKLLSTAESEYLHDLSLMMLDSGNYIIKVYALRAMRLNNFRDLSPQILEKATGNDHDLVKRTAMSILEEWDISLPDPEEDPDPDD